MVAIPIKTCYMINLGYSCTSSCIISGRIKKELKSFIYIYSVINFCYKYLS